MPGRSDYAHGVGWKVWVGLPGHPEFQQAQLKQRIPVPDFREALSIPVADNQLDLQ